MPFIGFFGRFPLVFSEANQGLKSVDIMALIQRRTQHTAVEAIINRPR